MAEGGEGGSSRGKKRGMEEIKVEVEEDEKMSLSVDSGSEDGSSVISARSSALMFDPREVSETVEEVAAENGGQLVRGRNVGIFKGSWELLEDIALKETGRLKKIKRRKKSDYDTVIDGLKIRSETGGFTVEELNLIWRVVGHSQCKLNCTQRARIALMMVPETKVSDSIVKNIVFWLDGAKGKGFRPTEIISVYQLLNLYIEYNFVEYNGLMNEMVATKTLLANTDGLVTPWKMRLFRNIATPGTISLQHVKKLVTMAKAKDAKKTHVDDILATLGVCKLMRPDLFDEEDDELSSLSWKIRILNYPRDVMEVFHQQRQCVIRKTAKELHPLADRVFPEFLPDLRTGRFVTKNMLEQMLKCLETYNGTVRLALSPALLEVFQQWLLPILYHRFHCFSALGEDDQKRYRFMYLTCITITKTRVEELPVLKEWLNGLLNHWDFCSFRSFVFELIPFTDHTDVQRKNILCRTFVYQFANYPRLRFAIWDALEKMYSSWFDKWTSTNDNDLLDSIHWVIDIIQRCVRMLALDPSQHDEQAGEDSFLLTLMCLFYLKMLKHCLENPNLPDDLKVKMQFIPSGLVIAVFLSENVKSIKSLMDLLKNARLHSAAANRELDAHMLAFESLVTGTWSEPDMEKLPELQKRIQDDMSKFSVQKLGSLKEEWREWTLNLQQNEAVLPQNVDVQPNEGVNQTEIEEEEDDSDE